MKIQEPLTNAEERRFLYSDLTESIISVFYEVYGELGFGFLESVYKAAMLRALTRRGVRVHQEVPVPVWFRGECIAEFRADLVVEDVVLVELKAVRMLDNSHEAQVLNYLRATPIEVALLLNFGPRPVVRRLAFSNERKKLSVHLRSSAAK